jgi:hypothetical protein
MLFFLVIDQSFSIVHIFTQTQNLKQCRKSEHWLQQEPQH